MAMFDNNANKAPIGVMLIRKGLIKESDIDRAIEYQQSHRGTKLGEIFHILKVCDDQELLNTISESTGFKPVQLEPNLAFPFTQYISMDIVKQHKVIPFEINENRIKVAFADPTNKELQKMIRLILLSKGGLSMDPYVTFASYIDDIIKNLELKPEEANVATLDTYGRDISQLIDNIIRSGMAKRASDLHFEPMENYFRVRFRIDGELVEIAKIEKEKQQQIIRKIKVNFKHAPRN